MEDVLQFLHDEHVGDIIPCRARLRQHDLNGVTVYISAVICEHCEDFWRISFRCSDGTNIGYFDKRDIWGLTQGYVKYLMHNGIFYSLKAL